MPIVNVTPKRIEIHKAGEGDAEWRVTLGGRAAGAGAGNYTMNWNQDGVSDNDVYDFNSANWIFFTTPGEKIRVSLWGYEEDGGLFDPSDTLPGVAFDVDPGTAAPELRVDADNGEFSYTLVWGFSSINI